MTILTNGSYEIAFQGANGDLWTYNGNTGAHDMGLWMDNSTSPSITSQPNGGFEVAFQANTGHLWIAGTSGTGDLGLGMWPSTSPAITTISQNGGYQIAYVSGIAHLATAGTYGARELPAGTINSPSIAGIRGSTAAAIAFYGPGGTLWTAVVTPGASAVSNTGQPVNGNVAFGGAAGPSTTTTG
jgi:hypothetical protein